MSKQKITQALRLRSSGQKDVPQSVQLDLLDLAKRSALPDPMSAIASVLSWRRGKCYISITSHVTTATSTGTDFNSVTVTRNGQVESGKTLVTYDGSAATELTAWELIAIGEYDVSRGDVLLVSITPTGSPTTTLSITDFTVLLEWRT